MSEPVESGGMREQLALLAIASLSLDGIMVNEEEALRLAVRIENYLWTHSSPCVWDGKRGKSLFMARGDSDG